MYVPITVIIVLLASLALNYGENKVNLKSKTLEDSKKQSNGSNGDFMKSEIKKYLPECGGESSDDEYPDSSRYPRTGQRYGNNQDDNYGRNQDDDNQYGQSSHGHHQNNRQNNGDNDRNGQDWSNRNSGRNSNRNNGRDSMDRNYGRDSMDRNNYGGDSHSNRNFGGDSHSNRNFGGHSSGRDYGSDSSNRNYGRDSSRNHGGYDRSGQGNDDNGSYGGRNYNGQNCEGCDSRNRDSYGGTGRYGSGSERRGYGGYLRSKRSDNMECISQCVFGYLEVLDDNRSPSESALLKWMQDNMPNDSKRVKAIREARRCFARLVSSDSSDGCEFSKSLSNCMRLGIEN